MRGTVALIASSLVISIVACGGGTKPGRPDTPADAAPDTAPDLAPADEGTAAEESLDAPETVPGEEVGGEDPGAEADLVEPASCSQNTDCRSGWCVESPAGKECAKVCTGGDPCPQGWECMQVATSPDVVFACVHKAPRVCRPCLKDPDCKADFSPAKMACKEMSGLWFCLRSCEGEGKCDAGFSCKDGLCEPGAGQCSCSAKYISSGDEGACSKTGPAGTCAGKFHCSEDGPTDCTAPEPSDETCNAKDDDCDGQTDEDLPSGPCDLVNSYGTCEGQSQCVGGKVLCSGSYAIPEDCNGIDDDCDGATDEGFADMDSDGEADCVDTDIDGDGHMNGADNCPDFPNPDQADLDFDNVGDPCDPDMDGDLDPNETDCSPSDPTIHAGQFEQCNAKDDDCDGQTDEGYPDLDADGQADCWDPDRDGDGIENGKDNCPDVSNPDQEDLDDDWIGDACDIDKDNDGVLNEIDNCPVLFNPDQKDENGNGIGDSCECDWDGDGIENDSVNCGGEPEDNCPWVANPMQEDIDLDGIGDACDPDIDGDGIANEEDNCPKVLNSDQADIDNDGTGDACDEDTDGDGDPNETDCAPADPKVGHTQVEVCNGTDDDCDGVVDQENSTGCQVFYVDADADGWGTDKGRCLCAADGLYTASKKGDCNDAFATVNPGAAEACNGIDDDCDGATDGADSQGCAQYWKDIDGDGWGNGLKPYKCLCAPDDATDYSAPKPGDCNDADPQAHPGVTEACNGKDDDCDGTTDGEGATGCQAFYHDGDSDGFGTSEIKCLCAAAAPFAASKAGDCGPDDPAVHPGAAEKCNGADDDCDGQADEAFPTLGQPCTEGIGQCKAAGKMVCSPGGQDVMCDAVMGKPGTETCNGKDDDCDGPIDEDLGSTTCGKGVCEHTVANCKDGSPQTCDPMQGAGVEVLDGKDNDCDGLIDEDLCYTVDFDKTPDGKTIAVTDTITNQYAQWGMVVTAGGSLFANGEPTSKPNAMGPPFGDKRFEFVSPKDQSVPALAFKVSLQLISVGDSTVTARAFGPSGNLLEEHSVNNPGTGVGWYNHDLVTFTAPGIKSIFVTITKAWSGDGNGADDLAFCIDGASLIDGDGDGHTPAAGDCDDKDPAAHPGVAEVCNAKDDDCDGQTDEEFVCCGNKAIDPGETCDDGNKIPGDGCDIQCKIEVMESCLAVRLSGVSKKDGWYQVKPPGATAAKDVWCDLNSAGGGWTRCAVATYKADQSTTVTGLGGEVIAGSTADSYFGTGGTAAIKKACLDFYPAESGFLLRHDDSTVNGPGTVDFEYAWAFSPLDMQSAKSYALVTFNGSCQVDVNVPAMLVSDADPETDEAFLFMGDGITPKQCSRNGQYSGTSSGWWMDLFSSALGTWFEISDTGFDRLGTWKGGSQGKHDGTLEFYVRAAPPAMKVQQTCAKLAEATPGLGAGMYLIDPDSSPATPAVTAFCDGADTLAAGGTVSNCWCSISGSCPAGLKPFVVSSTQRAATLERFVQSIPPRGAWYYANCFAGPDVGCPALDPDIGYLKPDSTWADAGIVESTLAPLDIHENCNQSQFDPIPLNTQSGFANRGGATYLYNVTETSETGTAICGDGS